MSEAKTWQEAFTAGERSRAALRKMQTRLRKLAERLLKEFPLHEADLAWVLDGERERLMRAKYERERAERKEER